ncbi:MAG: ABC transporter ATP-binding protein [Actinomycetota bacterium]|jgi:putative ABC transport system ATP-binding protein|nr:ABC transporter ATP-binding protein [Actinomycetota bacterium]
MISLELIEVSKTYPGAVPIRAVSEVDLRIEPGSFTAITGASGSGKSTLLNILGLLDRPTEGRYFVRGRDTTEMSEREVTGLRAHGFGFVFQAFHLLSTRTAMENVELGSMYGGLSRRDRRERARSVLERCGLQDRLDAFPPTLSGGEKQRVAIARGICGNPDVLLCDEPTGNLDSRIAGEIMGLLGELNGDGQTLVIVTHDAAVAARANRRVEIADGRISRDSEYEAPGA